MKDFTVTPWEVKGDIDYDQLLKDFGVDRITEAQRAAIVKKAGFEHVFLRRNAFFAQRDLSMWLDAASKGKRISLYTGRGPSGETHLGHLLPWMFTKYLQDAFDCPLYFQITDDEKFLFKKDLTREQARAYAYENILDIIAVGFNPEKTHIFLDTEAANRIYPLALDVAKRVTYSTAKATFGFTDASNIGQIFFTSMQSVPCMLPTIDAREKKHVKANEFVPVLIPHAIDQDPHFRVTRDVIEKIGFPKPASIQTKFMPSLKGSDKMSASDMDSSIYTTDTPEIVKKKVNRAFTGGRATVEEQRRLGGNPDICSVCQYLTFFFEDDDKKLVQRINDYRDGKILDGENKTYLAEKINAFLKEHQRKREAARKHVDKFMWR